MVRLSLVAVAAAVAAASTACDQPASGGADPQPPEPVRFERPAMVRFHMQRHFDDLREIERMLVAGKLEDGKTRAHLLTRPALDPGMAPWHHAIARVVDAARALETAPGIDEALRREARVAEACAECHLRTQRLPAFAPPAALPPDAPTLAARMARHAWAVDRLWEGMVGPAEDRWRMGLEALAASPLPFKPLDDAPALATRLRDLARHALATRATAELDERTRLYGELLVTCAACHATRAITAR
jgi:hypothetical protein